VLFLASVIWALDLQISFGRLQRKYRLPCYSLLFGHRASRSRIREFKESERTNRRDIADESETRAAHTYHLKLELAHSGLCGGSLRGSKRRLSRLAPTARD
jgi:hypothetical protein